MKTLISSTMVYLCSLMSIGLLTSCASDPPVQQIGQSQAAVASAERVDANEHASRELYEAKRKLAEAQQRMEEGDYEIAERLAEQAEVDAELALIKAQSRETEDSANEIQQSIQTMRVELSKALNQ